MGVLFNQIPANLRVPLFYAEVNAGPSPYQGQSRLLLIGQRLSAGTVPVNTLVALQGDPSSLFGSGSMLADMAAYARNAHPFGDIWCLPIADPAGVAQTKTVTIAVGILGQTGTMFLYIGGERVAITVLTTDANTVVAANLAAEINKGYQKFGRGMSHGYNAVAVSNVITLTARHVGAVAGKLSVDKDLVGDEGALATYITIADGVTGTGTPSLSAPLAVLGNDEFDWIAAPYGDGSTLTTIDGFLGENGRWGPMKQLYGHYITTVFDTYANFLTLGASRNDPNASIMPAITAPQSPWHWAATLAAVTARHKNLGAELDQAYEISRPLHFLELPSILPPKVRDDHWDTTERQALYNYGLSGYTVTRDGKVLIDRLTTTYRTTPLGQPDITWLDVDTRAQMVYILRYLRQRLTSEWGRHALSTDDPGNNAAVATPKKIKASVVAAYVELESAAITEKSPIFARALQVERGTDPNRVNIYLPVDVVNQLRVIAVNATTFLEYPGGGRAI